MQQASNKVCLNIPFVDKCLENLENSVNIKVLLGYCAENKTHAHIGHVNSCIVMFEYIFMYIF